MDPDKKKKARQKRHLYTSSFVNEEGQPDFYSHFEEEYEQGYGKRQAKQVKRKRGHPIDYYY